MAIIINMTDDLGNHGSEYPDKDSAIDAYNHLVTDKSLHSIVVYDNETDMIIREYHRG